MRRKIFIAFAFIFLILWITTSVSAQASNKNPYSIYSKKKEITDFDWLLVQVNLRLGETGYYVKFDKSIHAFQVVKLIDTYTLTSYQTSDLRDLLVAECKLVSNTIGSEFPEFQNRGSNDLFIIFKIAEPSSRIFASYALQQFSFTQNYYDFKKERQK